jgi:uncharacterized protein YpmS
MEVWDFGLILLALILAAFGLMVVLIILLQPREEETAYRYFQKGNEHDDIGINEDEGQHGERAA